MRWRFWKRTNMHPGSEAAARAGCLCPVTINNAGEKKPKGGWKTRSACPMHGQLEKDVTHIREVQKDAW